MQIRLSLLPGFVLAPALHAAPEPVRVLFLGNSFTARNNLAGIVSAMVAAAPRPVKMETAAITYGGKTMEVHWNLHSQDWIRLPVLTGGEIDQTVADLMAQAEKTPQNGNIKRSIERHEELRAVLNRSGQKGTRSCSSCGRIPRAA